MKNNFNDNVFNNNHPKTLENMYCDAMRNNIRRCNPGKSDEELGIDKPFMNENSYIIFYDLFNFIKKIFKKIFK